MHYEDMTLEVSEFTTRKEDDRRLGTFKVRVLQSPGGEMEPGEAVPVEYNDKDLQSSLMKLDRRELDRAGLIAVGRTLAALLLPIAAKGDAPSVRELFARNLVKVGPDGGLRLRLRLPADLTVIPWEYAYIERAGGEGMDGFLALDPRVAIVRHEVLASGLTAPRLTGDIKVVAALAGAEGLPELNLDDEMKFLNEALSGLEGIQPQPCQHATLKKLQPLLPGAGVFHFSGHGDFTRNMGARPGKYTGDGYLAFEDEPVGAEQMGINLRGNGVRLAVLAGCHTGRRDGISVWSGIAPALVKAEIPAVVANQYTILDKCAIAFSHQFYQALAGGLPIERAVSDGRIAAYNADQGGRDWGVPVLYLRSADGRLFDGAADPQARERSKQAAEADVKVRASEVKAGGVLFGADVRRMLDGELAVAVSVAGTVSGELTGFRSYSLEGGSMSVQVDVNEVGAGGRVIGLSAETVGTGDSGKPLLPTEAPSNAVAPDGGRGAPFTNSVGKVTSGQLIRTHVDQRTGDTVISTENPFSGDLDFTRLINERTRQFTGRDWVFKAVNEWLNGDNGPRVFLLAGEPGTGKTAIAARSVRMNLGQVETASFSNLAPNFLTHFHFCQAGLDTTLSPLTFVQALSETLANRYPAFRKALESGGSRQIVVNSVVNVGGNVQPGAEVTGAQVRIEIKGGDARPMFDEAVRRPLQVLCRQLPAERIVILVDSLDEALGFNADNNIARLLELISDFPPKVRFFLTCRSNSGQVFDLVGQPTLDLIKNAPPGLDEVRLYATSRLNEVPEPLRSAAAERIADKSKGNFLYAYHVINDLIERGADIGDADTRDLPEKLEDVYRKFLERELGSNQTRWNDVYRPLVGCIAVARGEGLTKTQLIEITDLAEDTATDVLKAFGQYLVGGGAQIPYRIYHESFRDFLLYDEKFTVFPAERHAAIARYLEDKCGANWATCNDVYALKHTPVHWAEAASLSDVKREKRTQALIELSQNPKYQRRFERRIGDVPALKEHLHRAVQVAALNNRDDMLPWLIRAPQGLVSFHRDYLQTEAIVKLAEEGKLDQAEARLQFTDVDDDWQVAARLIIAWLGTQRNLDAAVQLRARIPESSIRVEPLSLLARRLATALGTIRVDFVPELWSARFDGQALSLEVAQELVKRVSGQPFDRELLLSVNPSLIAVGQLDPELKMIRQRGYAAAFDAPILVNVARKHDVEGTALVDRYIDAHAGYDYVEYRNRSLWFVLHAVLRQHPEQDWVKQRLRRILVAALTGGGVDFREMLPLTALLLRERANKADARLALQSFYLIAIRAADELQNKRGADDSWGNHKRRLTGLMELYELLFHDGPAANVLLDRIRALPDGFAGFQAPAYLRLADALRACDMNAAALCEGIIEEALRSAHHIQDYHFCARVTARCNALKRWHQSALTGQELADAIRRLAASPADSEFAADHLIHEPYAHRAGNDPDILPITNARRAETLDQLVEVFQRPAVEFRRLNPNLNQPGQSLLPPGEPAQTLGWGTRIRVPDPGFPPLLAVHFAARALADESLDEERGALLCALVPVAASNPTALDTLLSYLLIANQPDDPELLEDIVREAGPVVFGDVAPSTAQIGPDAATPA